MAVSGWECFVCSECLNAREGAFVVCMGYGGVIGCVAVRVVLSVTEHKSF